jgi:DNA-binding response OmpR family regulator
LQKRGEDLVTGMEPGADYYTIKPFKHNELEFRSDPGRVSSV